MEELEQLYGAYLGLVAQLNRDRKLWDGAFGLGGGPADNPCHEKLVRDVEAALAALDPAQRPQAVEYILRQPLEHKDDLVVYYTLMAAQGATIPYLWTRPRRCGAGLSRPFPAGSGCPARTRCWQH